MRIKRYLQGIAKAALGITSPYVPGSEVYVLGNIYKYLYGTKARQMEAYDNKIVYAYVNVLVRKFIEAPVLVWKVKSEPDNRKVKNFSFKGMANDAGRFNLLQLKALEELESHPLIELLDSPNKFHTGIELREHFWFNYNLTGDGFIWSEKLNDGPRSGKIMGLYSLQADKVMIVKNQVDFREPVLYYLYSDWNGVQHRIAPENMFHLAKWSTKDPILGGYSPIMAGAKTISKNEANQLMQGSMYSNGGPGLILSSDTGEEGQDRTPYDKWTSDQIKSMQDSIQKDYSGAHNAGRIHMTNGLVKVQKLGESMIDMNAIEADKSDWQALGAVFGVSPIIVGDMSGGTENNVKAAYKALVTNVIVSELRKFDAKFAKWSKDWFKGEKIEARHDLTEFTELAPDLKLMKEVYGDVEWLTENEKRKLFNFDEDKSTKGMSTYWRSTSKVPIEDLMSLDMDAESEQGKQYDYK